MPGGFVNTHPDQELVHHFFSDTGPTYDYIANLCTFGFDLWWKKKILEEIPENSRRIMDQACGTGILTLKLTCRFPRCHVTGVELRDEYLHIAREKVRKLKLKNIDFIQGRAEDVFLKDIFDCNTLTLPIWFQTRKRCFALAEFL
jgi:demethylmenaquinone methyltransferase/2-methoxy-6-polyprenyl-1,4-benzoquinol methylase